MWHLLFDAHEILKALGRKGKYQVSKVLSEKVHQRERGGKHLGWQKSTTNIQKNTKILLPIIDTSKIFLVYWQTRGFNFGWFLLFFSSVRSSNSHPDLLLIHHHPTPTFSDHTGPQHWTFTFWATTAISKAITGLICWLHVYLMGTTGHHCKIVQDTAR